MFFETIFSLGFVRISLGNKKLAGQSPARSTWNSTSKKIIDTRVDNESLKALYEGFIQTTRATCPRIESRARRKLDLNEPRCICN